MTAITSPESGAYTSDAALVDLTTGQFVCPPVSRAGPGELDVHQFAQLVGRDGGDAHADGAVALIGDPFVRRGVFQMIRYVHAQNLRTRSTSDTRPPTRVMVVVNGSDEVGM